MISLTDQQLAVLMQVAGNLPVEKRAEFIERTAAYLHCTTMTISNSP
jgi:hypothetical protein